MFPDATSSIVGIGIDLVDCPRLSRIVSTAEQTFRRRVFTSAEWDACSGQPDPIPALAARFAAKEACLKALGTGWAEGLSLNEVALVGDAQGRSVELELSGAAAERASQLGVRKVYATVANHEDFAAAMVVLCR